MAMLKRIQYHRYGGPEVMRLEEFEAPRPGRGEVLVRVRAAAANPMDWKIRRGDMKLMTGRRFPRGLGHDFAGVVEAVGEGVTRLRPGDDVFGAAGIRSAGAFAEMVVADEAGVAPLPDGVTYEEAAALPIVAVTALQALKGKGRLQAGQAVFVHACLGGVGRAATQIASILGASVGGSCRAGAGDEAAGLGVAPVVGFEFDPAPLRGRFDVVLDTAGTLPAKVARALLKPSGRIVDINPSPAKLVRSTLPGPYGVLIAKVSRVDLEEVARAAGRGELRLPIARRVPLADGIEALTELEIERSPRGGKVLITME